MMLNMHIEFIPEQHAQVDSLCELVRGALWKQGVASEYASQFFQIMEDAKSPLGIAEALVGVEKTHSLNLGHGVSLVPGTFPTYAARALEKDVHQDLRLAMLIQSLKGAHQTMTLMGYRGPDVIVMTTRPPHSVGWTDGYEELKGLIDQAPVWLGQHPRVVVVDPLKPKEAVSTILGALSSKEWARYAQITPTAISDYDRFMGLDTHALKLSKTYLKALETEAELKQTTLDALVASILKKHLLDGIVPPTGEST